MATAPSDVAAVVVQEVMLALPLTLKVIFPIALLGAVLKVPVTAALKVRVEPNVPAPLSVSTTPGVILAITTESGAVAVAVR